MEKRGIFMSSRTNRRDWVEKRRGAKKGAVRGKERDKNHGQRGRLMEKSLLLQK